MLVFAAITWSAYQRGCLFYVKVKRTDEIWEVELLMLSFMKDKIRIFRLPLETYHFNLFGQFFEKMLYQRAKMTFFYKD